MPISLYTGDVPNRATQDQSTFSNNVDNLLTYIVDIASEYNALAVGSETNGTWNSFQLSTNGTAAAPVFRFSAAPATGLYSSSGIINMSVGGVQRYTFGDTTFAYSGNTMTIGGGQVYRAGVDLGSVGAIIEDQKTSGTAGGSFNSGADRTRDLNTYVYNGLGLAPLSANQFTLPAGTYIVRFEALAYEVNGHATLLYNVTDATVVGRGMNTRAMLASSPTSSAGVARFTIAASKVFELRHRCVLTAATNGFGQANNIAGVPEVYARVEITKLA